MDLLQYLRICHNIVTGVCDAKQYKDKVRTHACCAHFMKMISERLSRDNIIDKNVKKLIIRVMGLLVINSSIQETNVVYI